ncbi:MAG: IS30 family transposase [Candidatus Zophobacter franzmannii]|nr:IS30 family transposase [Candidatus Zophobacter franzmannii]
MTYRRVTATERRLIRMWRQAGYGQREISRRLDRAPSSICREVARNTGGNGYQPGQAHTMAQERAKRPGPRRFTEEVKADAESRLQDGWTPDIISGRARLEGRPWVCKETIYKHIYADAKAGGNLWKNLPRARRKRRRRCPRDDGHQRGHIPNRRMIDTRPAEVETRASVGHWEGDLINGANKTGNLVTLVERSTRFTLLDRTQTKEAKEVTTAICRAFGLLPLAARLSLTLDNGKEFAWHEKVAQKTGMDVFFAMPYHSWERGTNENTNGLVRRLHPKKSSFSNIGKAELKRIDTFLNDRPRKCLGWMTPREKMAAFLASAP